ncbi:lysophospholipid acyltransferase family protein [Propionibacteriaceae bacterium Y1923]|uniref:lysophospholipid acyltransferase family protein n=1 Tax=Aestuariimicrobium sp. Y1814 TaxID=3418742 RepID=UPI003C176001
MATQAPDVVLDDTSERRWWSLRRANSERAEPVFRGLARLVHGACTVLFGRTWFNSHKLPRTGGVVVVSNHMSYMDALILGEYMIWSGRWPRFLGKAELWSMPVIGWLARQCGQIPVYRKSARAGEALVTASAALEAGSAVTIFPEGTETRDPDYWPMSAHTGAARLALQGDWPLIPIAQWGAQEIMPNGRPTWPRLIPRKHCSVVCGDPVDLSDLRVHLGTKREAEAVRAATDRVMDSLTDLLAQLREEQPPAEGRWDFKSGQRVASKPTLDPDSL